MENIVQYLRRIYPRNYVHTDYFIVAMRELTTLVGGVGVAEARKKIRERVGSCPHVVKLWPEGTYTFKRCAYEAQFNGSGVYMSRDYYGRSFYHEDVYYQERYVNGRHYYTAPHNIIYDGVDLAEWIVSGEECEECGVAFISRGSHVCPTCEEQDQPLAYTARIEDLLPTEETKDVLMGVELEYENLTARDANKSLKGHALAKRDSSIHSGVEVVTRPASLKTHKERLQGFYKACKVAAASNTGMHVHIDKKRLSNYQIGFMLEFLNKESLIPDIEHIAGRQYSTNTYCRSDVTKTMTWGLSSVEYDSYKNKLTHSRRETGKYSPLNTGKDKTVEIRIFASPNSYEECAARLDFVNALIRYSSPYSVGVKSLKDKFDWGVFSAFIASNRKEFPDYYNHFVKGAI